jgi:hypothetical protein
MKKIIFFFTLVLVSNSVLFSQNISGEVEYEIRYYQCTKCKLTGKIKELYSILKVSDFHYLPHIYFTALEGKGLYGCTKSSYCAQGGDHRTVESDPPTYEKQRIENVSKSRYYGQEINMSRLQEVSKKISTDFTKWKKIYDEEKAKKDAEKAKVQKELEIAKQAKIEEQRSKLIPVFDSLINNKNFIEASLLISQNENTIERELLVEIKKGYHDNLVSFLNDLLNRYDFQSFDSQYNNLRARLDYSEKLEFEKNRIFKSIECEVNKIKATTISEEELLLVGDWTFISNSLLSMKIKLNQDKSFEYESNWYISDDGCVRYPERWEIRMYHNEFKGYWKLFDGNIEFVFNEYFNSPLWLKTKANSSKFGIIKFKKDKLNVVYRTQKCESRISGSTIQAYLIDFKGERSK